MDSAFRSLGIYGVFQIAPRSPCAYAMRIRNADHSPWAQKKQSTFQSSPSYSMRRGLKTSIYRQPWRRRWRVNFAFEDATDGALRTKRLLKLITAMSIRIARLAITLAVSNAPVCCLQKSQRGHAGAVSLAAGRSIRSSGASQYARGCSLESFDDGKGTRDASAHAEHYRSRQRIPYGYTTAGRHICAGTRNPRR